MAVAVVTVLINRAIQAVQAVANTLLSGLLSILPAGMHGGVRNVAAIIGMVVPLPFQAIRLVIDSLVRTLTWVSEATGLAPLLSDVSSRTALLVQPLGTHPGRVIQTYGYGRGKALGASHSDGALPSGLEDLQVPEARFAAQQVDNTLYSASQAVTDLAEKAGLQYPSNPGKVMQIMQMGDGKVMDAGHTRLGFVPGSAADTVKYVAETAADKVSATAQGVKQTAADLASKASKTTAHVAAKTDQTVRSAAQQAGDKLGSAGQVLSELPETTGLRQPSNPGKIIQTMQIGYGKVLDAGHTIVGIVPGSTADTVKTVAETAAEKLSQAAQDWQKTASELLSKASKQTANLASQTVDATVGTVKSTVGSARSDAATVPVSNGFDQFKRAGQGLSKDLHGLAFGLPDGSSWDPPEPVWNWRHEVERGRSTHQLDITPLVDRTLDAAEHYADVLGSRLGDDEREQFDQDRELTHDRLAVTPIVDRTAQASERLSEAINSRMQQQERAKDTHMAKPTSRMGSGDQESSSSNAQRKGLRSEEQAWVNDEGVTDGINVDQQPLPRQLEEIVHTHRRLRELVRNQHTQLEMLRQELLEV